MKHYTGIRRLAVFCGASVGCDPIYSSYTEELANAMSAANIDLVYGGGKVGLMGCLADRMLKNGRNVIGVIPQFLADVELAHRELTELRIVSSMHERKAMMASLADGFIILPGGIGSLEEFFEIVTLKLLGQHKKPCGILNVAGYYDGLITFLTHIVNQGFLKPIHQQMIFVAPSPSQLIEKLLVEQAPVETRWASDCI